MEILDSRRLRFLYVLHALVGRRVRLETVEASRLLSLRGTFHTATPFLNMPHRVVVKCSSLNALTSVDSIAENSLVGATFVVDALRVTVLHVSSTPIGDVLLPTFKGEFSCDDIKKTFSRRA